MLRRTYTGARPTARANGTAGSLQLQTGSFIGKPIIARKRHMRFACLTLSLLLAGAWSAKAEGPTLTLDAGISSLLIDRGEQLAGPNLELAASAEFGSLFASVYRITPFGDDDEVFAEEVDYTIGYAFETDALAAVLAANWLTFPGLAGEATLELDAEVVLDAAWSPGVYAWTAPEFGDSGFEVFGGPETDFGPWTLYGLGRAGAVYLDEGEDYTYWGLEAGAQYPLGNQADFAVYLRYEAASEELFADTITGGEIETLRSDGLAVGLRFAAALETH